MALIPQLQRTAAGTILHVAQFRFEKFCVGATDFFVGRSISDEPCRFFCSKKNHNIP